jgi:two-component system, LuxR family, response regulator FixJ
MTDGLKDPPGRNGGARQGNVGADQPADDILVFLVDDDDAVRDAVAISLRTAGFRVVACGSARQLLESYRDGQRGCLVVDLDLPDLEMLLLPMSASSKLSLPTIMTSRRLRRRVIARAFASLPAVLLEKPFGIDDLLPLVKAAIAGADKPA